MDVMEFTEVVESPAVIKLATLCFVKSYDGGAHWLKSCKCIL